MIVDPFNITNYERTDLEIEAFFLFCLCVAGKNAMTIAHAIDQITQETGPAIFKTLADMNHAAFISYVKSKGLGQQQRLRKSVLNVQEQQARLGAPFFRISTPTYYEKHIVGVGPKTSRFFIVHSQPDASFAILDTHILKFLRDQGVATPSSTPSAKKYLELETAFLRLVPESKSVAAFDLEIWKQYRNR